MRRTPLRTSRQMTPPARDGFHTTHDLPVSTPGQSPRERSGNAQISDK
jgi:hypothetical protein